MFLLSYWQLAVTATIRHKAVRFNRTASSVGNIEYKEGVHEKRVIAHGMRDNLPPNAASRPNERKPNKKPPEGGLLFGGDGGARTHDLFDVNEAL